MVLLLRTLWRGWMRFSHILGLVMSTVILTALWIVGFGLYAVLLKIVSIPQLFAKPNDTYWIEAQSTPVEEMQYPF